VSPPVIVGGGPAGCAAAIALAGAGIAPRLIERSHGATDKVCGDFLGADAIHLLNRLGCDPIARGAEPIRRVRLVLGRRIVEAALPFAGLSLSRRTLDAALLARAEAAGAMVQRGHAVRRIVATTAHAHANAPHDDRPAATMLGQNGTERGTEHGAQARPGWLVDGEAASAVFLATGKHDVRDHPRSRAKETSVGLKQYLRLPPQAAARLGDATELTLFPGGYAGLQPVEGGRAALCIAVRGSTFQAVGGWEALLAAIGGECPRFADLLDRCPPLLPKPLAVAGIPYGLLRRDTSPGLFRLGDQAAVIPSLTGDGMAIALHSGLLAAATWCRGGDAMAFQLQLRRDLARQMWLARALHAAFMRPALQPMVLSAAVPLLIRSIARWTRVQAAFV